MGEARYTDAAGGPVTVLVARRVRPGKEIEFEDWAEELTRAASHFDGFLGAGLLRPGHVGDEWNVVYRFATPPALADWETSSTRARLLAKGEQMMSTTNVHRVTGLETWFELPGRTAPAPPRWKMFIVSAAVIFVLQLMLNFVVRWVAPGLWLAPRVAVIAFAITALMTWFVQPQVARLLEGWLYAPRRSETRDSQD
jgi:antibiotic biosynthesis monooxygenase (ABM) superfamily enzyme